MHNLCSSLELFPQHSDTKLIHNPTQIMACLKRILDAYQVPIVPNPPRPVLLSLPATTAKHLMFFFFYLRDCFTVTVYWVWALPKYGTGADRYNGIGIVVPVSPVVEKSPHQLGYGLPVTWSERTQSFNIIKVCAPDIINPNWVCRLHLLHRGEKRKPFSIKVTLHIRFVI